MRGISWLAANQLAAQEGLCTVEWLSTYNKDLCYVHLRHELRRKLRTCRILPQASTLTCNNRKVHIHFFNAHCSVNREFNLITVQQDATYSFYYISVGSSSCFWFWNPSSAACTTVITACGIDWLQWVKHATANTDV